MHASHSPFELLQAFLAAQADILRALLGRDADAVSFGLSATHTDPPRVTVDHFMLCNDCNLLGSDINADVGRTAHQTLALQAHWDAFVTGLESIMQPLWHVCARNKQSHVFVVNENPDQPSLRAKLVSDTNVFFYIFYEQI